MPMMSHTRTCSVSVLGVLAVAIGTMVSAGSAAGEPYRRYAGPHGPMPAYVVAESRYGHGTVSGPVRMGRVGPQVRLPGGNWIDCKRSCSETLRQETVDFWENAGHQRRDDGPGYLSLRFWF
jgi:hypothetical protein